jgi:hypothetical protein
MSNSASIFLLIPVAAFDGYGDFYQAMLNIMEKADMFGSGVTPYSSIPTIR